MKKTCVRKTKYINIMSNRFSHIYFLLSDYSMVICVANSHCLQNVRRPTGGSEFARRTAHSAVKFVFYKSQPLCGKWRTHISAPFCAYASYINETPGLSIQTFSRSVTMHHHRSQIALNHCYGPTSLISLCSVFVCGGMFVFLFRSVLLVVFPKSAVCRVCLSGASVEIVMTSGQPPYRPASNQRSSSR